MTFCQYKQLVSGSHHEFLGFYLGAEWTPELIEFMDTRHPFLRSAQVLAIRISLGCLLCQGLICPSCVRKNPLKTHGYYPDGQDKERKPVRGQPRIPNANWPGLFMDQLNSIHHPWGPGRTDSVYSPSSNGTQFRKDTGYTIPQMFFLAVPHVLVI